MKNIVLCLIAILLFGSCHHSGGEPGMRGNESMVILLLPEPPYDNNDLVEDVIQQLKDKTAESDVFLSVLESPAGEYDNILNELLTMTFPGDKGSTLLVTIDNSMQLTLYESDALGQLQKQEHHRLELYGVGYLSGLCVGLIDYNTLIMQGKNQSSDNLRYGEGFRAGFERMKPESDLIVQFGSITDGNELIDYANDYSWELIITQYGVANPFNGEGYLDFYVDYGYGRLVGEYLDTWVRQKARTKAPDEVISLKSGYIQFVLDNEQLLGELVEVHWNEAIELEEQYITPYIPVE